MLALAAVLWMAYLVPVWFKRREYLATERNAVRLQQTLRIMAETAEVPAEVRAESNARSIAEYQKVLKQEAQKAEAAMRARNAAAARAAAARLATTQPRVAAAVTATRLAQRRLRRTRAFTTLALLASVVAFVVQAGLMIGTGVAPASWFVLLFSAFVATTSFALLGRLASVSRARAAALAAPLEVAAPAARRRVSSSAAPAVASEQAEEPVAREWTPVPVPKPLYLSRRTVAYAPMEDPTADLRAAALAQVERMRAAERAAGERAFALAERPAATPATAAAPAAATAPTPESAPAPVVHLKPSRWATMGQVDTVGTRAPDIDAALRRRRAAG